MKLRTFLCYIAAAFVLTLFVGAADIVDSGECGDNLTWTLDSDGVLTISGTGAMDNYGFGSNPNVWNDSPWATRCNDIITAKINDGVTSIGDLAFSGCENLTSVTISNDVTIIGYNAFRYCNSLMGVTVPDGVTAIDSYAFYGCEKLASVIIPDSVTFIGEQAFAFCRSLTSVTIPDSVTAIGNGVFNGCYSLTNVTLFDSVTSISAYAFGNCYDLTSITIPDSVTIINQYAFLACDSLTDVYYSGSVTQWKEIRVSNVFNDALKSATIHYGAEDIGIGIALTDKNGKDIDPTKDVLGDNDELTATFNAVEPDAASGLVTASVFIIFYDSDGLMVSLEQKEIDLSDPFNLMFILNITVPTGAKTLKFLVLGDNFEPLRAVRLIDKPSSDG